MRWCFDGFARFLIKRSRHLIVIYFMTRVLDKKQKQMYGKKNAQNPKQKKKEAWSC